MRSRLIIASLTVHAAIVAALFITGFWRLDRLDAPRHTIDIVQPGPPPPAPAGGPQVAQAEPFKRKEARKVVKELRQPAEVQDETKPEPTANAAPDSGGSGSDVGPGNGSGPPDSTGDCTDDCGPPTDKPEPKPPVHDDRCGPDGCQPKVVSPTVIRGMRVAGETQIQPPDIEKTALMRSGTPRAAAAVKVCVGDTGAVTSLAMFKGSGYAGWDAAILGAMRNWRYKPHTIGGRAVPVCGVVTFVYEIR
jgi:TonB family protein